MLAWLLPLVWAGSSLGTVAYSWWAWQELKLFWRGWTTGWGREDLLYLGLGVMVVCASVWMLSAAYLNFAQASVVMLPRKKSLKHTKAILLYALLALCVIGILVVLCFDGGSVFKAVVWGSPSWVLSPMVGGVGVESR